jgi:hypothetical protein
MGEAADVESVQDTKVMEENRHHEYTHQRDGRTVRMTCYNFP